MTMTYTRWYSTRIFTGSTYTVEVCRTMGGWHTLVCHNTDTMSHILQSHDTARDAVDVVRRWCTTV